MLLVDTLASIAPQLSMSSNVFWSVVLKFSISLMLSWLNLWLSWTRLPAKKFAVRAREVSRISFIIALTIFTTRNPFVKSVYHTPGILSRVFYILLWRNSFFDGVFPEKKGDTRKFFSSGPSILFMDFYCKSSQRQERLSNGNILCPNLYVFFISCDAQNLKQTRQKFSLSAFCNTNTRPDPPPSIQWEPTTRFR